MATDLRGKLNDAGLALLRVGVGLTLAWLHGRGKLAAASGYVFSGHSWDFVKAVAALGFPAPGLFAVLAALAESVGAFLVAVGLGTRLAAAVVAFNMAVAVSFHVRGSQPADLAAAYLVGALTIVLAGAGRYSLDEAWSGGRRSPSRR